MRLRILLRGVLGYFPWILNPFKKKSGGASSARYCYSVWLRHLSFLYEAGMQIPPVAVAEIGPGASLGIGLNALITGSKKYYAFDIITHSNTSRNIEIFDELIELYRNKTPIPNAKEFPNVKPKLKNYNFPFHIFSENKLRELLNFSRIKKIRKVIISSSLDQYTIKYFVPWNKVSLLEPNSVDLIISQAVMEHVLDVKRSYQTMYKWLKKNGFMSHEIDYSAHETHNAWFGHWQYPSWLWEIIMRGRSYVINRYPNSYHINTLINNNFKLIKQLPDYNKESKQPCKSLTNKIQFTKEDMKISSCYIIVQKK